MKHQSSIFNKWLSTWKLVWIIVASVRGFSVETSARKRLGKKSFLLKEEKGYLKKVATADELKQFLHSNSMRKPGSTYYRKAWIQWRGMAIDSIRYNLSRNLPTPSDKANFENLFFRLGVAADVGEMPSFTDAGARSGYALEFFCRGRNLANIFLDPLFYNDYPQQWENALLNSPMLGGVTPQSYNIISLGGGPAFDHVGAALAATYSASGEELMGDLKTTVFDYEEGWSDLVEAMNNSTKKMLQQTNINCYWGGKCDITKSLSHPINQACQKEVEHTNLFTCQYCVAENSNLLHDSEFIFFRDLFESVSEGTIFIFTETTPRVWPEFYKLIQNDLSCGMQIHFRLNGKQMLIQKNTSQGEKKCENILTERDGKELKKFEKISMYHERKINSGWERQQQKNRGS